MFLLLLQRLLLLLRSRHSHKLTHVRHFLHKYCLQGLGVCNGVSIEQHVQGELAQHAASFVHCTTWLPAGAQQTTPRNACWFVCFLLGMLM
jgi:hypothetical protein